MATAATGEEDVTVKAGAVDVRGVIMVGILLAKRPRGGVTLISGVDVSVGLAKRKVFFLRAKQEETVEPQKSCKRSVGPVGVDGCTDVRPFDSLRSGKRVTLRAVLFLLCVCVLL